MCSRRRESRPTVPRQRGREESEPSTSTNIALLHSLATRFRHISGDDARGTLIAFSGFHEKTIFQWKKLRGTAGRLPYQQKFNETAKAMHCVTKSSKGERRACKAYVYEKQGKHCREQQ